MRKKTLGGQHGVSRRKCEGKSAMTMAMVCLQRGWPCEWPPRSSTLGRIGHIQITPASQTISI